MDFYTQRVLELNHIRINREGRILSSVGGFVGSKNTKSIARNVPSERLALLTFPSTHHLYLRHNAQKFWQQSDFLFTNASITERIIFYLELRISQLQTENWKLYIFATNFFNAFTNGTR